MHRLLGFVMLVAMLLCTTSNGQTITWVGGGTAGAWTDINNWSPARLPMATDDVSVGTGAPAIITVSSGTHEIRSITSRRQLRIAGGSLTVAQVSTLTGFAITGGTLTLNGPATSSAGNQITAGLLNGTGDITCTSNTNWSGGEIAGTGVLTLAGGTSTFTGPMATSYELVLRKPLVISATCNIAFGTLTLADGVSVTLDSTGVLNFNTSTFSSALLRTTNSAMSRFFCNGQLVRPNGSAFQSTIQVPTLTLPGGRIRVDGGRLEITLVGDQFGSFEYAAGSFLTLAGFPSFVTMQSGSRVTGSGNLILSGLDFSAGTFQASGGFSVRNGDVVLREPAMDQAVSVYSGMLEIYGTHRWSSFSLQNGSISYSFVRIHDSLTLTGANTFGGGIFDGPGSLTFDAGSTSIFDSNSSVAFSCTTQNLGTMETRSAGFDLDRGAVFYNRPSGVIRLQSGAIAGGNLVGPAGTLVNEGLISSNYAGTVTVDVLVNMPTGVVEAVGPASLNLSVPASGHQGRITSTGDISLTGPFPIREILLGSELQLSAGGRILLNRGDYSLAEGFAPTATELSININTLFLDADLFSIPVITAMNGGRVNVRSNARIGQLRLGPIGSPGGVSGTADLTVATTAQLDGSLTGTGRLILAPTCVSTTSVSGTRNWSRPIENQGTLNLVGGTITLSNTTLLNTGTMNFDTSSNRIVTINGVDPALLRNLGTLGSMNAPGTGAANINCRTDQLGTAVAPGSSLNFNGPVNQLSGDALIAGRWATSGTGILRLPNGTIIRVIGPGASVVLGGAVSSLPWLSNTLYEVDGELELQGFRALTLTPAAPTGFANLGRVILGTDASLSVLGAYRQALGGTLITDYDEPPIDSRLRAFSFQLDGTARANFTNGFMIDAGVPLRLLGGGTITGRFASTTAPQSRRVVYAATSADWRFVCIADTDDGGGQGTPDGGVTIDDLLYYLAIYTNGVTAADVDDGSNTGTPDGGATIDDLLYFLVRYEAGC